MYFIDVINENNQSERVYIDKDVYLSVTEPTFDEKNDILLEIIKELEGRNTKRGIRTKNKKESSSTKIVTSTSASTFKKGKRVPIFNQKEASDLTIFNDGTYDINKVKSQNYNDDYFDFSELKKLL